MNNLTNLMIVQGDAKAYNLTFTSGGEELDITGATVQMSVKRKLKDQDYAFPPKVVTDHTDPENGKTTVALSTADTSIDLGDYYYDIQISGGSVTKKTILKGKLTITWQVTEE